MSVEKSKKEIKERLIKGAALSDDELEQVNGGFGTMSRGPYTYMRCSSCNSVVKWAGNYMAGTYLCSGCGQEALKGDVFVE